jgi:Family of unknown function (DUF6167)
VKRLFYLAAGAGLGVAAVRKLRKAASKLTPSGLAGSAGESLSGLFGSARGFLDDVRAGMAERETELHEALTGEATTDVTRKHSSGSSR